MGELEFIEFGLEGSLTLNREENMVKSCEIALSPMLSRRPDRTKKKQEPDAKEESRRNNKTKQKQHHPNNTRTKKSTTPITTKHNKTNGTKTKQTNKNKTNQKKQNKPKKNKAKSKSQTVKQTQQTQRPSGSDLLQRTPVGSKSLRAMQEPGLRDLWVLRLFFFFFLMFVWRFCLVFWRVVSFK